MRPRSKVKLLALLLAVVSVPASATFHLMKVVEIFPGTAAAPQAQYVVIQMYASGQEFVGGHALTVFNASGASVGTFSFPRQVANGANQAKILIATSQAESFFGVTADLVMSPAILSAGGKVCWADTIDCVAWGRYTGGSAGVGTPFNASGGLTSGRAAVRRLNIAGSATVLDAGDDTDNSASDFVFGSPAPRNNAGMLGRVPAATCGNGVLEGLEQCDDHNTTSGDGCSSTCAVEAQVAVAPLTPVTSVSGDFDHDGRADVFWRSVANGANTIWRSGNRSTPIFVTGVTDQAWKVVGIGDFNGDLHSDVLWRDTSNGADTIWRSGNRSTPQPVTGVTSQAWQVAGIGDFDGDHRSDILWRNLSTGNNTIWKSGNSATQQFMTAVTDQHWKIVGIGDFDGDGHSDVLWRNTSNGANTVWRSGNRATSMAVVGVTDPNWQIAGAGDFDGDGRSDILWRNTRNGANTIWRSANRSTSLAVAAVTDQNWVIVGIGDFDGDHRADILWRHATTGTNAIWKSGNRSTSQTIAAVSDPNWRVVPQSATATKSSSSSSISLSIADLSVTEGNSGTHAATFTVRLSGTATAPVTYDIATRNGTAIAGSDYMARSITGETIAAGLSSRPFVVTILGDAMDENNETFNVNVSNVHGAAVADGTAVGAIVDDDYSSGYGMAYF